MSKNLNRRSFMGKSLGISTGVLAGLSFEHQALLGQLVDRSEYGKTKEPVKGLQRGKFGKYEVSRLIIGGNLISGSAHAGDLLYQSALMTHYFTHEKIMETWALAEQNGINTTLMRADPHIVKNYNTYRKERGGKLQWIVQTAPEQGDPVENAKMARDNGAIAVYLHGGVSDGLVRKGQVDEIGKVVEGIKKAGIFAGVGGHRVETVKASEEAGLNPDFYMYTVNKVDYMASNPEEIQAFMKIVKKPWIGFKVLGAGRDKPQESFIHAFERGADFIAVGMFDWQVMDDVAFVQEMLAKGVNRERPWRS
ncbi:MAG TPA: hypothetical protein VMW44_00960 [Candidatus Bathyarchaeia archaeon]|nr:hypothetical protein [Candidatus Bathyarchaeia archaeon]